MNSEVYRALARESPGVVESSHQGHADFRVRGKIFATLGYPDEGHGRRSSRAKSKPSASGSSPACSRRPRGRGESRAVRW